MTRKGALAAILAMLFGAMNAVADLPDSLSIPEAEFEGAERDYQPIPTPDPSGGPVNQLFEYMELDMTGTLPEAVLEEMLGETPYDHVDVVWGMEVTGDWSDRMTGEGTLQVTDLTEGRGASPRADPERFTGQQGFRMYNARLQTDGDYVFTLSAAFPPDQGGVALGTELEAVKGLFEVTWLCHMFEPGRTGCVDYPDEYYETELPELGKLHIIRTGSGYKIDFTARVRESRTHRERGYRSSDLTGRFGDVRGWVCDRASWKADPDACVGNAFSDPETSDDYARKMREKAQRQLEEALDNAMARAADQATEADIERQVAEVERQMQEEIDTAIRQVEADLARARAELAQADIQREVEQQRDEALRQAEEHIERVKAEAAQAEIQREIEQQRDEALRQAEAHIERVKADAEQRRAQQLSDELARRAEAEIARINAELARQTENLLADIEREGAVAGEEEALAESEAETDEARDEDKAEAP